MLGACRGERCTGGKPGGCDRRSSLQGGRGTYSGQPSQCSGPFPRAEKGQVKDTVGHYCPVVARGIMDYLLMTRLSYSSSRADPVPPPMA